MKFLRLAILLPLLLSGFVGSAPAEESRYALAIHGGAGWDPAEMSEAETREVRAAMEAVLRQGARILDGGGSSLDCVESVVRALEDDPHFNAGKGAAFNSQGAHELDAAIMDGSTRACGAVAGVRTVRNPVSLARLVMLRTRHVLLIGDGAEEFATEMKVERVENRWFDTPARYKMWREAVEATGSGTVGCVARDRAGNLAAATSTGGLTNKKYGRVGDSPILGAGTYADNATCAVSCTGTGEEFIRHAIAKDVSLLMAYRDFSVAQAVDEVVLRRLRPDDGGVIAVAHDGSIAMGFNTAGMARAAADSLGRFEVGIGP